MDGDGYDGNDWASQDSGANAWSGPAHAPAARGVFDLNSQAAAAEEYQGLEQYGAYLQGDDVELLSGRGRGSGLPITHCVLALSCFS